MLLSFPRWLPVLLSIGALLLPTSAQAQQRRPNVVFILADDLGWTDACCYGSKYYETPAIDRLAKEGMRFTSAYTCGPNCAPTRAALVSGQYGPRTGIYTVGTGARGLASQRRLQPVENVTELPLQVQTIGQAMKSAGYTTGLLGKWHLGQQGAHHPSQRGFDQAITSMGKHFGFATQPRMKVPEGVYLADWLTDQAVDFIRKNRERPFFLYLSHFAVHTPIDAKKELSDRFRKKLGAGGHSNPVYAGMIASVDESVARVLAVLEELQLAEDTIVIFTSDNGGVGGYAQAGVPGAQNITNNAPLRGGKGMLYEGGVRVIWIVRWPGRTRPGSTTDVPIASIDLFPTLLEISGGQAKAGHTLDGVSIVPVLKSPDGQADLKRDALYWHFPGYLEAGKKDWRATPCGSIRQGDWKLLEFFEDGRLELYNLKEDLGQKKNLAAEKAELTREMHRKLRDWRTTIRAPLPRPRQGAELGRGDFLAPQVRKWIAQGVSPG